MKNAKPKYPNSIRTNTNQEIKTYLRSIFLLFNYNINNIM